MSDAGDEIQVDAPAAEVEVSEAPKGKMSVEDALQVCAATSLAGDQTLTNHFTNAASPQKCARPRWARTGVA